MKITARNTTVTYDYNNPDTSQPPELVYTPRPCFLPLHQQPWKHGVIIAHRRCGKEQPLSEPVLTPTGFVPMRQIKPDSLVIGMDGMPHKVLAIFPQGVKPIYKIKFSDGSYTRAGLEHLWRVYKNFRANKNPKTNHTFVLTTKDLLKDYKKPHPDGGYTHPYCLPQQMPVHFNKNNTLLPLHPYVLGVLLGDGSFYNQTPRVANPIPEIRQKLVDFGYDPADVKTYGNNGTPHYNIRGIFQTIKNMGLCGQCYNNKFVPEEYLFASPEDRLLLLQGLMDTDGSVSEDGKSSFSNCNNNLIEAVCWLARSLGMIATVSTTVDYRTKSAPCKTVHINSQVCPFLAEPNKVKRWRPSKNCKTRRIVDISYDGEEEAQCILVDSEDHTYLTRDFIITHNTFAAIAKLLERAFNEPPLPSGLPQQVLFTSPQLDQAVQNTMPLFTTIGKNVIADINKGTSTITLINGARIIYCGAKTIEKVRGLYLTGWLSDEVQAPIENAYSDIIYPAIADTDGWTLRIGTARSDDDYLLYNTYKYLKEKHGDDPEWLFLKLGINESHLYDENKLNKIKEEFWNAGRAAKKSSAQIQQGWNCEYEADFSFIDEGKPNVSAKFYEPLSNIFNNNKFVDTDKDNPATPAPTTAVLDIASGNGRDYTVGVLGSYSVSSSDSITHIDNIMYDNDRNLTQWAEDFKALGIKNVVLPFDAAETSKESGLNLFDFFLGKGFKVFKIKRLLHKVQEEHAEWLLNRSTFDSKCIAGLRELGKFDEWAAKHKLSQDIASAICYAGQYFRKVDIKEMRASKVNAYYEAHKNEQLYENFDMLSPFSAPTRGSFFS